MITGIDMEILGGHHVGVVGAGRQVITDRPRQCAAAGHGQRTTLAEVVLYVDNDQRAHIAHGIAVEQRNLQRGEP